MNEWDRDVAEKRDRIAGAQNEDQLLDVLEISGSSPEAYYATMVWAAMRDRFLPNPLLKPMDEA